MDHNEFANISKCTAPIHKTHNRLLNIEINYILTIREFDNGICVTERKLAFYKKALDDNDRKHAFFNGLR